MVVQAILFDTRSIQKYIFAGNKLKTNIGASYLVEKLYQKVLVEDVLQNDCSDVFRNRVELNASITLDDDAEMEPRCQVGYIGGGKALLLFKNVDEAQLKRIVQAFTKKLLVKAPGLKTGAAICTLDLAEGKFKESFGRMHKVLKQNQRISPRVNAAYTGLTVPCSFNGEVAQIVDRVPLAGEAGRFVSAETIAKLWQSDAANARLHALFSGELELYGKSFAFPQALDKLGQIQTENYIAIVHIDGNNMGAKFSRCESLQKLRAFSTEVKQKSETSFRKLLREIVGQYEQYERSGLFSVRFDAEKRKSYLPLRPLILGGDDVTFVCMGRMAVQYAKRYIEFMQEQEIDCCGGIAILPTSYPFFRGYELAEQLCGAAKARSREDKMDKNGNIDEEKRSSWLDFAILHGEQAPELEQIRRQEYRGQLGDLHFGPYKVCQKGYRYAVENLLEGVEKLREALPKNKIKELRFVLAKGKHEIASFMEQLVKQGLRLPQVEALKDYERELWWGDAKHESRTPYLDIIEMMDFTFHAGKA